MPPGPEGPTGGGARRDPAPPVPRSGAGAEGFPRALRLTRSQQYRTVLRRGRRTAGRHLVTHVLPNRGTTSRLGLIVSRRVGNAVLRNRLRRRLKEIFRRRLRPLLDERHGPVDLVVQALPGAAVLGQADLEVELRSALERTHRRGRARRSRPRPKRSSTRADREES